MRSYTKNAIGLSCLLLLSAISVARADFTFDDIDVWVGSGSNQAAMVMYWNAPEVFNNSEVDAPSQTLCLAWGYRFDGQKNGEDMLNAIVAADPRLYAMVSGQTQYGKAVFALGYDWDNDGVYGITDGETTYTAVEIAANDGYIAGGYNDPDYYNSIDEDDVYWGGWYGPNWELWQEQGCAGGFDAAPDRGTDPYWTGDFFSGSHGEWGFSEVGITSISLEDGSWVGWSVAAGGLDFMDPSAEGSFAWANHKQAPILPATTPEPATMAMLILGGAGLLRKRRK